MALSIDDVRKIASLARLRFTPDEELSVAGQLGRIVEYIDQLQRIGTVDAHGSATAAAAVGAAAPHAPQAPKAPEEPDVIRPCLPREAFLANAPAVLDGFLLVPEIKAGGGDGGLH